MDFYRNGILQIEPPLKLKQGSPITDLSMNDLPSPRIVVENDMMKNA